jgi:amino acid transporter
MQKVGPSTIDTDSDDGDRQQMINMGYKQELSRGMNGFMSFAIGFTEVTALISLTSIFTFGLTTGGPVVMAWGWIITFVFTMIVALNFAEICSVFPCAGSVYHWSGVLAPKPYSLISAYWTGLFNWLGNVAGDASFAFIFAQFVSAALVTGG